MNHIKKHAKRLLVAILCLTIFISPIDVFAKTNSSKMKGVTWDLKPNKTVAYYTKVEGAGFIKQKVKMSKVKTKSISGGKVQMDFDVKYTRTIKPSAKNIVKMCKAQNGKSVNISPRCYIAVIDYNTGLSLLNQNSRGVTVSLRWTAGNRKTFSSKGYSVTLTDASVHVTIIRPKSYKRMCICVGGWNITGSKEIENNFWTGKVPFWKVSKYHSTKHKKTSHAWIYKSK